MRILLAIAATALTGLALPQTAEAGRSRVSVNYTYVSGHSSCGCPIYTQRICGGYDRYHRPIYRYVAVPVRHRCGHSVRHYGGYGHASYATPRYRYAQPRRTARVHYGGYIGQSNRGYIPRYPARGCR